jgi:hypothetical protein
MGIDNAVEERRPDWVELERIVTLREASELTSLSLDSLHRHHGDKIIKLTPRRDGMKLKDVLALKTNES